MTNATERSVLKTMTQEIESWDRLVLAEHGVAVWTLGEMLKVEAPLRTGLALGPRTRSLLLPRRVTPREARRFAKAERACAVLREMIETIAAPKRQKLERCLDTISNALTERTRSNLNKFPPGRPRKHRVVSSSIAMVVTAKHWSARRTARHLAGIVVQQSVAIMKFCQAKGVCDQAEADAWATRFWTSRRIKALTDAERVEELAEQFRLAYVDKRRRSGDARKYAPQGA